MAKNIVLLFDGTSNEIEADRTNILRLYGTLAKTDDQLVYYDPGVGTLGARHNWSRLARKASEIWGLATGTGLHQNVLEAYEFLVRNYAKDAEGNRPRLYLFGFSRGAYTARVLAGFLHAFGLLEPRNLNLLPYAYRAYRRVSEVSDGDAFAALRLHERVIRPDRPPIRLLGLFDTVASVIEAGRITPWQPLLAFTARNPSVEFVRHAVSSDERRSMFRAQLWPDGQTFSANRFDATNAIDQDCKEVRFPGVHGDVGGGYPESKAQLAKAILTWMIEETRPLGLDYKTRTINEIVLGVA